MWGARRLWGCGVPAAMCSARLSWGQRVPSLLHLLPQSGWFPLAWELQLQDSSEGDGQLLHSCTYSWPGPPPQESSISLGAPAMLCPRIPQILSYSTGCICCTSLSQILNSPMKLQLTDPSDWLFVSKTLQLEFQLYQTLLWTSKGRTLVIQVYSTRVQATCLFLLSFCVRR